MFNFKSEKLLKKLEEAIARTQGRKVGCVLRAVENMDFVVFHEFGTATHFNASGADTVPGIQLKPPPDSHSPSGYYPTPGSRLPITEKYDEAVIVPENPPDGKYLNPGVRPTGAIQSSLPDTLSPVARIIAAALISSQLDMDAVQTAMVEEAGPLVTSAVAERIGETLGNGEARDTPGRLRGESPADAFENGIAIEPLK